MKRSSRIWNGVAKKPKRIKIRKSWKINPRSRVKDTKRRYSRKNKKRTTRDEVKIWSS